MLAERDIELNTLHICGYHKGKKLEIYCETCFQLLCVQCILTQEHKSHEMLSVSEGCAKE